jgi:hypothetical protein
LVHLGPWARAKRFDTFPSLRKLAHYWRRFTI